MARFAPPPVPYKVYRHFAVITLVLTFLLALFANGENRQAIEDELAAREQQEHLERVSAERARGPRIARREETQQSRFDGGDTQEFGKPMQQLQGGGGSSTVNPFATGAARTGTTEIIPGYSRAYLDSLTEEQYRQLLASTRAAGRMSAEEREAALAGLSAGSQRRSGMATPSEELVN